MKWLIRIGLAIVAVVLLFLGVGLILPSSFKVQRSIEINAPADKIYGLIADPREWKKWAVWNQRDPNMQIDYAGPQAGTGAKWTWRSKSEGNGSMEFTTAEPVRKIGYALSFPDFGMNSSGALTLDATAAGTRITWTNEGDVGGNPMNHWFAQFMDSLVGPDFEAGLKNLKALAEKA